VRKLPLKETLRSLLAEGKLEAVAEMAAGKNRVLGSLVALTFDADEEVGWRAIEAMGMGAERLSVRSPSHVKEHMRRLYWLITEESGACFWRAPESMAELGARLPRLLQDFVPIAFHLLETLEEEDLEHFRPGALYAVGRLAHVLPQDLPPILPLVVRALDDPDPQARGMAVWCLGQSRETGPLQEREGLLQDQGPVRVYRNRMLERTTVGDLVREILEGPAAVTGP
jgi:AraC family transcriptional regulator, regulatory protein of adaptative response / methylated-DNA-[protein]-cysteine methyltransferase